MRDQEIIGLWEAYQQVHAQPQEEVEQLDEITRSMGRRATQYRRDQSQDAHMKRVRDHQEKMKNDPKYREEHERLRTVHSRRNNGGEDQKESVDLFDIIKEHLLDEGYANTERAALAIMANMSEEWKQSIVEGVRPGDVETPLDKAAFKKRRRSLAGREASADAKKRGHVDKFTGKPYGTEEAASRRKDIHKPEKAPEREARRKAEEDPD